MGATARDTWEEILQGIRARVPEGQFHTWFEPIGAARADAEILTLRVPNEYFREWLGREYQGVIEEAATHVMGARPRVAFSVDPALPPPEDAASGTLDGLSGDPRLHPDYTFEAFVCGPCNRLAHAACAAVAAAPGGTYNPLYIYGPSGVGKSHLLQATCHRILDDRRGLRVIYTSCEAFVNEFISSVQRGRLERFRSRCRGADVLVMDDLQFLARAERSQEEFFHTFNALYNSHRQIVLSADAAPDDLRGLEPRLTSRFKNGLVARLDPPAREARVQILRRKAEQRGRVIPEAVLGFLADQPSANVRELEGALIRVIAYASLLEQPLDLEVARKALGGAQRPAVPVPLDAVARTVARFHGMTVDDLRSRTRRRSVALPRQICMYLARQLTPVSLEEIGRYFGGRDHSTVLHGVGKIGTMCENDDVLRQMVSRLALEIEKTHNKADE